MIRDFSREHLDQVVELHHASLTGLLAALGRPAIRAYYKGSLESRLAIALIAEVEGAVAGFVSGSTCPTGLRREVVRANPIGTFFGLVAGCLSRPRTAWAFAESLRKKNGPRCTPELTYLAVAPDARGQQIGQALVNTFGYELSRRGVCQYELSVDADNRGAREFYRSLGFRKVSTYLEFGRKHIRLRSSESSEG